MPVKNTVRSLSPGLGLFSSLHYRPNHNFLSFPSVSVHSKTVAYNKTDYTLVSILSPVPLDIKPVILFVKCQVCEPSL